MVTEVGFIYSRIEKRRGLGRERERFLEVCEMVIVLLGSPFALKTHIVLKITISFLYYKFNDKNTPIYFSIFQVN